MIDSPGIRSFGVDDLLEEDLMSYFPDIEELAVQCKFSNCSHLEGTKGCYFQEKLNKENRNGLLIYSRLDSFMRMQEEISEIPHYIKNQKKS
jgi:ribosome biogenesis GTPase